jgi:OOP family OmpA-OmpF porin
MKNRLIYLCGLLVLILCMSSTEKELSHINMGPMVNSKYDELHPYVTPDGQKLFFVREDDPQNFLAPQNTQDIWYCKLENNEWSAAKHLTKPFNRAHYNTIFYQSADGNQRLIRGAYKNGNYLGSGYSVCRLTKNGWSDPQQIKIKKIEKLFKSKSAGLCMGSDNKTMIHYLDPSGKNIHDLYVSFLEKEGVWSEPRLLGPDVNTEYTEMAPFIAADGVTLYFSSNRPGGYGNNDIYMTKRLDSTWKSWSKPVNLGPSVNTNDWDAYYTIPASGEYAYIVSSSNTLGGSDIVKIKLQEDIKPNPVVLIRGVVRNAKTKEPLEANISYNILSSGKEAGIASSNPTTGEYQIILPSGDFYGYKGEANGFYAVSENIDLKDLKEYKEIVQDLYLIPAKTGEVIRLNNIFFETGKSELKPESFPELNGVVDFLSKNNAVEILISGHTDNIGKDEANLTLSENRAKAVVDYLISKGISNERLSNKGFGESVPVASNDTEEGRAQNRRVEFTIVKQ